jgi:hypothetical protein
MLTQQSPGCYRLESELTFATVAALRPLGLAALAAAPGPSVVIELGAVTQADSADSALLVGQRQRWARTSKPVADVARAGAASDVEDEWLRAWALRLGRRRRLVRRQFFNSSSDHRDIAIGSRRFSQALREA